MRLLLRLFFTLLISQLFFVETATAQSNLVVPKPIIRAEVGTFLTTSPRMPFWFRANQYGTVPLDGPIGTLRLGLRADYGSESPDSLLRFRSKSVWEIGYGIDVVGNGGKVNQVILPEAYLKARYKNIEVRVGRWRGIMGITDTLLTSGSYAWSGNAQPLPRVQIGTRGFVKLPFAKKWLTVNAFFGHGWFGSDDFVQGYYLHQKGLYARIGKPNWRVKLQGGFNHQAEWGGYAPFLKGTTLSKNGYLPEGLESYFNVVIAQRGAQINTVAAFEGENRIGNHLGSFDTALDIDLGRYKMLVYRQFLYETGSLYYLTSVADGLNGISIQNAMPGKGFVTVDRFLFEFFYSASQGGDNFVINNPQLRGRVNYFNHSQYQNGWSYKGHTIGTPFLTQAAEQRGALGEGLRVVNNRVILFHVGAAGTLAQRINWSAKFSFSNNAGTFQKPYLQAVNQFSGIISLASPVKLPILGPATLNGSVAFDNGQLLDNTTGVFLSLRKTFGTMASPNLRESPPKEPTKKSAYNPHYY
jgi:Capsule assembly protein Wzi